MLPPLNAPATDQPAPADAPARRARAPARRERRSVPGQAPDQAGLTLTPWGGGAAQDDTTLYMENGHSIQITTMDEYQGVKITFNTPVSLGDLTPTRFLQMSFHFPKVTVRPAVAGGGRGGRRAPAAGAGRASAAGAAGRATPDAPAPDSKAIRPSSRPCAGC